MEVGLVSVLQNKESGERFFDIVEYSTDYLDITEKVLNTYELQQEMVKHRGAKCDFSIENGTLRCNSMIKCIQVDQMHLNVMRSDRIHGQSFSMNSLYALLERGVKEDFFLVEEGVCGKQTGVNGIAKFYQIRFSKATMTVHALMHSDNGFYHKMIITHKDGTLTFHPFCFATKEGMSDIPYCTKQEEILELNGVKYELWKTDLLSIYDDSVINANCLINYGMYEREVFQEVLCVLREYIGSKVTYPEPGMVAWAGSGNSYKSAYGVYFSSSYKRMPKVALKMVVDTVCEIANKGCPYEEAVKMVKEALVNHGYSAGAVYAALVLLPIASIQDSTLESLSGAMDLEKRFSKMLFWKDFYLFRVRAGAFLTKKVLAPYTRPVLVGGRTKEFTNVSMKFYY